MDFSTDGRYMALAERRDCKDYISVFVCDDWHLLRVSETHTHFFTLSHIHKTHTDMHNTYLDTHTNTLPNMH